MLVGSLMEVPVYTPVVQLMDNPGEELRDILMVGSPKVEPKGNLEELLGSLRVALMDISLEEDLMDTSQEEEPMDTSQVREAIDNLRVEPVDTSQEGDQNQDDTEEVHLHMGVIKQVGNLEELLEA